MCFSISNYFPYQVALGVWAVRRHSKKGRKIFEITQKENNLPSLFILPLFIFIIIVIVIYISPSAVSCTAGATVLVHSYAAPALEIDRKFARQANNVLSQNETHITS